MVSFSDLNVNMSICYCNTSRKISDRSLSLSAVKLFFYLRSTYLSANTPNKPEPTIIPAK